MTLHRGENHRRWNSRGELEYCTMDCRSAGSAWLAKAGTARSSQNLCRLPEHRRESATEIVDGIHGYSSIGSANGVGRLATIRTVSTLRWTIRLNAAISSKGFSSNQPLGSLTIPL